jgi:hypothetical protein
MDSSLSNAVYWGLAGLALILVLLQLVPLVPRRGLWFRTTPNRDQSVSVGLLVFCLGVGIFGVRQVSFVLLILSALTSVVFQSWGPKRWSDGRVYGAYFVPLRIRGWNQDGDKVTVRFTWGCRVLVKAAGNAEFLIQLASEVTEGEGLD